MVRARKSGSRIARAAPTLPSPACGGGKGGGSGRPGRQLNLAPTPFQGRGNGACTVFALLNAHAFEERFPSVAEERLHAIAYRFTEIESDCLL